MKEAVIASETLRFFNQYHNITNIQGTCHSGIASLKHLRSCVIISWLRRYATSCKVAGSIPDEIIGFFN
jgi:hypothetical protein